MTAESKKPSEQIQEAALARLDMEMPFYDSETQRQVHEARAFLRAMLDYLDEQHVARQPKPVRCPECVAAGERSTTRNLGGASTAIAGDSFYDEDGRCHNHDPNVRTSGYLCSKGHQWESRSGGKCWCGWAAKTT